MTDDYMKDDYVTDDDLAELVVLTGEARRGVGPIVTEKIADQITALLRGFFDAKKHIKQAGILLGSQEKGKKKLHERIKELEAHSCPSDPPICGSCDIETWMFCPHCGEDV